jgi:hypothetical protein
MSASSLYREGGTTSQKYTISTFFDKKKKHDDVSQEKACINIIIFTRWRRGHASPMPKGPKPCLVVSLLWI